MADFKNPWEKDYSNNPWANNTWGPGSKNGDYWSNGGPAQDFLSRYNLGVLGEPIVPDGIEGDSGEPDYLQTVYWLKSKQKDIDVQVGQKIIRIQDAKDDKKSAQCYYWFGGEYHDAIIEKENLTNDCTGITKISNEVITNEVANVLARCESLKNEQAEYKEMFDYVQRRVDNGLSSGVSEYFTLSTNFIAKQSDKVETIQRYVDLISAVYNPVNSANNVKFFDETLIIPLTNDWFKENHDQLLSQETEAVKSQYEESYSSFLNIVSTFSGSNFNDEAGLAVTRDFLLLLHDLSSNLEDSPEKQWLANLSSGGLDAIHNIIYLSDEAWRASSCTRFIEYLGIMNTLRSFYFPPVFTTILCECKTGSLFFLFGRDKGRDEHLLTYCQGAYEDAITNGMRSLDLVYADKIDCLYECNKHIQLLSIRIALSLM